MAMSEPVFRKHAWHPLRTRRLPPRMRNWLLERDSLSRRLEQACPGGFEVVVRCQRLAIPEPHEARALDLRPGRYAMIREVTLTCNGRPCVHARSVVPLATLAPIRLRFRRLGVRPLGNLLFSLPHTRRGPVEIARIQLPEYGHETLWARRSLFRIGQAPLLVVEAFLPALHA